MVDDGILGTAHDLDDGIHLADVAEKFVPQSFALRRAFYQPGDIDELDCCRDNGLSFGDLGQRLKTRIWHGYDAYIRIDRAKRIIRRLRFTCAGDSIKQSRFTDVWQTYNS